MKSILMIWTTFFPLLRTFYGMERFLGCYRAINANEEPLFLIVYWRNPKFLQELMSSIWNVPQSKSFSRGFWSELSQMWFLFLERNTFKSPTWHAWSSLWTVICCLLLVAGGIRRRGFLILDSIWLDKKSNIYIYIYVYIRACDCKTRSQLFFWKGTLEEFWKLIHAH